MLMCGGCWWCMGRWLGVVLDYCGGVIWLCFGGCG